MDIYYLRDNWLQGPITQEELKDRLQQNELEGLTPAWSLEHDGWIPARLFGVMSDNPSLDDTALIDYGDTSSEASRTLAAEVELSRLPSPRQYLALRLAKDQELITEGQCQRALQEILENPNENEDLPRHLYARGWITQTQYHTLQSAIRSRSTADAIPGFEILETLGSGGMGTTYKARQISMDRVVALKVLLPKWSRDSNYVRRFEREARMAARLNHENIATAYEVGSFAGNHYLAMEYVEGQTLSARLADAGPFTEGESIRVIKSICRALQHAWQHSLIHRDISSKNVILRKDGVPKLIDMGLARTVGAESSIESTSGVTVGTPAYMSPEQALGREDVDIRSDIFSLGCVFYEMLCGEAPLTGETMLETLSLHINNRVPSVRETAPRVTELTARIIQKMTARDPQDRFQTPQEVIDAFASDVETIRETLPLEAIIVSPVASQIKSWEPDAPVEILLKPAWREYMHLVARKLDEHLEMAEVDPEFQGYVQTAFAELVSNAFDHGCKGVEEGLIKIRMELNDAFFRLEVEDPGPGFPAKEKLQRIKNEPVDRERQRGIIQLLHIVDLLEYSAKGNAVKTVLYRKSGGSGIFEQETDGIHFVQIKGKGDLALTELFKRWAEKYPLDAPRRICLMVRTDWVSSMFVGVLGKFHQCIRESGSAMSVWVEYLSCFRIMQQLGVTSFVRVYNSIDEATLDLRLSKVADGGGQKAPMPGGKGDLVESEAKTKEMAAVDSKPSNHSAKPATERTRSSRTRVLKRKKKSGLLGWLRRLLGEESESGKDEEKD